jgi:hypothetical protein
VSELQLSARRRAEERARRYHERHGRTLEEGQIQAALLHRRTGADLDDPFTAKLIELGIAPLLGGAVGSTPAATFATVPSDDFFVIAPEVFDEATILNVWQSAQKALPAFGQADGFDLPGRGLLAEIEVRLTATVTNTAGTGTITYTDYWPYGILDNLRFTVNGSPLLNAQGLSYDLRRQVVTRRAPDSMTSAPVAPGANTVEVHWIVPIADNLVNLWGAILTQSDDLYARLEYTVAAQTKLVALTGNATMVITAANLQLTYFAYDVPIVPIANMGEKGVLPDTDVLHRFSEFSVPVIANGDTELRLQQTAGEIERVYLFLDNVGSIMDPASWNTVRFQFAETEEPITILIANLLSRNARHYLGRLTPKATAIDFAYWNQRRDAVYPKGVANPKVIVNLPSSVTPNAGARLFGVQESLVGGA